jgi:hypothetical protein
MSENRVSGLLVFDRSELSAVNKFGRNPDVDNGVSTDIWDDATPIWVPPTAARVHAITSGDAADTAAGAGAQAVEVQGLDANWRMQTENVELAGAGSTNTVGSYIRIFRMNVIRVGANGVATANITATAAVDGTVTASITTPNNQTLMAIYTVPLGCTAYVTGYYAAMNRATPASVSVDINLFVKPDADVSTSPWQLKHIKGIFSGGDSHIEHKFDPWLAVGEKSDIKMQATDCTTNDTDISAGFDIVLRQE